jgi:hypothetical protein
MRLEGISYNPSSGVICRHGVPVEAVDHGYIRFKSGGRKLYGHRVAWYLTYGYWPEMLDHINQDKTDNRLVNLRQCTSSTNNMNKGLRSDNTSGSRGVSFDKRSGLWEARHRGSYLGRFSKISEAVRAKEEAENAED